MIEQLLAMIPGSHTAKVVSITATIIGMAGGALGCFAVLRRQSLLGDVLAHAALPGLVIAAAVAQSRSPLVLAIGALIAALLAALMTQILSRQPGVREDSALAIILAGTYGLGVALLSVPLSGPSDPRTGIERYLLGQAGATLVSDLTLALVTSLIVALVFTVFFWRFQLVLFDPDLARIQGHPVRALQTALSALLAAAIVIGLSVVGVVLMTALIVGPALGARPWVRRLLPMVLLSSFLGGTAGLTGAIISSHVPTLPTGPIITLLLAAIVLLSFTLAPRHGLLAMALRRRRI
jgi:manganese/zinc/iron transport system permease protein